MGKLRLPQAAARVRADLLLGAIDVILTAGSYVSVLLLRFDASVPAPYWRKFQVFIPLALTVHLAMNVAWGLYRQMWRHASVAEARRVLLAGISAVVVLEVAMALDRVSSPQSVVLLGGLVVTTLVGVVRFQSRLFALHRLGRENRGVRVLVVGAGAAGAAIAREMQRNAGAGLVPVGFVDDDPRKQGRSLAGVPVLDRISRLVEVAAKVDADQVVLAIPSADAPLVLEVSKATEDADIPLKILPSVDDRLGCRPSVRDVRDLKIEDLLGRSQVVTDLEAVRRLVAGKRVLITGAGGSIGSEIARQLAACNPGELVLLDHDDTHLHDVATTIEAPSVQILADLRDRDLVRQAFETHRPEVVFHAGAHKHVPILEKYPCEAVRTNVMGTLNVVDAAVAANVQRFVFISTDKAVHPSSIMGITKWLGEQLTLSRAPAGHQWCAVRFGNVLGSRGSVIPTFARQISMGGPVTVTDPRMTRYFMSVAESVQLVLQAAVLSTGNEVFMLEMGQAMRILELAERMIRLSGRRVGTDIAIEITGSRPGEKLVEELRFADELPGPTAHPSIVRVSPSRLPDDRLDEGLIALADVSRLSLEGEAARVLFELSNSIDRQPLEVGPIDLGPIDVEPMDVELTDEQLLVEPLH